MNIILSSVYLGNIDYYTIINKNKNIIIDINEHFQKQSFRNRSIIHGANGVLNLIIPLVKRGVRTKVKDVKIDNSQNWQKLHWRSIQSAYRSSPYFEYYENEFINFYKTKYNYLIDFNNQIQQSILKIIGIDVEIEMSNNYLETNNMDYRQILHPKKKPSENYIETEYIQVFSDRNGFLPNLSIVDLLFNEGPNAINFLG